MGRQRIRPMYDGSEGHTGTSLGRCQLIQQYLIQRTGKNRTRKQISSRIQRLRRMHHDDPASMLDNETLFAIALTGHIFFSGRYIARSTRRSTANRPRNTGRFQRSWRGRNHSCAPRPGLPTLARFDKLILPQSDTLL